MSRRFHPHSLALSHRMMFGGEDAELHVARSGGLRPLCCVQVGGIELADVLIGLTPLPAGGSPGAKVEEHPESQLDVLTLEFLQIAIRPSPRSELRPTCSPRTRGR